MYYAVASLDREKLDTVQSLEKKLGKTLLAFSGKDISAAPLKDAELSEIKETEKKLGVTIVAVK